jgi:hypothetical protein
VGFENRGSRGRDPSQGWIRQRPCHAERKAPLFMGQDTNESVEPEAEETGLPGFRTWNRVYLLVLIHFAIWIVLLIALTHLFS